MVTDGIEGYQYIEDLYLQRHGVENMCHVFIGGAQKYL
jgi:hypothetical protein